MQVKHSVQLRVLEILAGLRAHDLDLLLGVAEGAGEDGVGEGFEAFGALKVVPGAYFFLLGRLEGDSGEVGTCEDR